MKKLMVLFLVLFLCTPVYAISITDNVDFGGEVRLRGYDFQNFWTFDYQDDVDNFSTFRLKSSLYAKFTFDNDVSGFIQFTNQTYGDGVGLDGKGDNYDNKVFADNAYINVKNLFTMPVDLRVGRQNLMYGSGFVLFDGQSQFASTSIHFDGVKLSVHLGDNAVLDGLYFKDQENDRADDYPETDDITLSGAYLTAHCPVVGGQQEIYALNKNDQGMDKSIWMYGLRLSDKLDCGLDYSGEIAYQTGDAGKTYEDIDDKDKPIKDKCTNEPITTCEENSDGEWEKVPTYEQKTVMEDHGDQEALGYKLQLGYTVDVVAKPRFFIGYASLEGDESGNGDYDGWDSFYGGWPQFGDLLSWVYVNNIPPNKIVKNPMGSTVGEDAYTNLNLATAGISTSYEKFFCQASYTQLKFDENIDYGDDFGDYYQLKASYKYTKNLSFSMYAAMIDPGRAFERQGMTDEAYEFYWETRLRF